MKAIGQMDIQDKPVMCIKYLLYFTEVMNVEVYFSWPGCLLRNFSEQKIKRSLYLMETVFCGDIYPYENTST